MHSLRILITLAAAASAAVAIPSTSSCTTLQSKPTIYWLDQQDHTGSARGYAPFINNPSYPVYRNVLNYSVSNDGTGDQTANLQKAIDTDGQGGSREGQGTTNHPAEVYLPAGTYQLGSTLNLRMGTILVGDPLNRPVIKAAPNFNGNTLVNGYDNAASVPEDSFFTLMKNVVLDTTAISPSTSFTALQWGVAQACGLTNVEINMPDNSSGHTGININGGSTIAVTDVTINGGVVGIQNSNQQVNFKNVYFKGCRTAFAATGGKTVLLQGATFDTCGLGVDMSSNALGTMVILDSNSTNSGNVVRFHDSSHDNERRNSQLLIQNLSHGTNNAIAVDSNGNTKLAAISHVDTWVWGNLIPGVYQSGLNLTTQRAESLLANGKFFTKAQPTYAEYASDQVVNVKAVSQYPVKGDGKTDDSASLNAILKQNAANCKITYFPYGVYIVKDTLVIPAGSRIVGEAWAVISGSGSAFSDASNPKPVVQVGNPGDIGVVEIQDMRFTVAQVSPGAKIVEVNAAGTNPGDVGFWNVVITAGGTADTTISTTCTNQDSKSCMAAFMLMHLTNTSSTYIENMWGWTADHNLDGGPNPIIISTGRGLLVEATKGTWLTGTGFEHNWLYNYNFHHAQNLFAGMLQSETPYMQGAGAYETVPAPWTAETAYGDPDYSWCAGNDQKCRSALATNVDGGSDIALYNSAAWAFFEGYWNGQYNQPCNGPCQTNMMRVANSPQNLVWYSISTKATTVMVLDGKSNPAEVNNPGGWEAVIQAYRQFAA
ncbi:hypothetical protein VTN77DRAFT_1029 [Rasamsonia byssochlamydoides]|uniref:uncharacterized protein n=1 Tax=Rasamsonia byssochlamydoides TaxID=89139 RepID=UPI0037445D2D